MSPVGDPVGLKAGKLLNDARKCLQASIPRVPEKQEGRASGKTNFHLEVTQAGCDISLQIEKIKAIWFPQILGLVRKETNSV